jgi:hypothetical protein
MIRVNRPFDRWFDLSDPYDDVHRAPRSGETRPEAHREWTYDAPRTPVPIQPQRSEPAAPRPAEEPRPPAAY